MKIARVGALLGSVLLIAACGSAASPSPTAEPPTAPPASNPPASVGPTQVPPPGPPEKTTLRVVQGSDPDFAQTALSKSFEILKEKYGVTVEYTNVTDTDTATRAVIAGQQDIVVNSLYFGINAVKSGIPLKTMVVDGQTASYLLMGTSDVGSVTDLVGQTVGIGKPGDLSSTVANQCLKASGVDPSQVQFVQVGGTSARLAAILAGQIKAVPAAVPEGLNAMNKGPLKVLADCGAAIGSFLQTGATASSAWISANPNLAQAFVDSFIDSLRWAVDDKAAFIEQSKKIVPEMDDALRSSSYDRLKNANYFAVNGGLNPDTIAKLITIGLDAGSIEAPVPDDWYTLDFIDNYLARNSTR